MSGYSTGRNTGRNAGRNNGGYMIADALLAASIVAVLSVPITYSVSNILQSQQAATQRQPGLEYIQHWFDAWEAVPFSVLYSAAKFAELTPPHSTLPSQPEALTLSLTATTLGEIAPQVESLGIESSRNIGATAAVILRVQWGGAQWQQWRIPGN